MKKDNSGNRETGYFSDKNILSLKISDYSEHCIQNRDTGQERKRKGRPKGRTEEQPEERPEVRIEEKKICGIRIQPEDLLVTNKTERCIINRLRIVNFSIAG